MKGSASVAILAIAAIYGCCLAKNENTELILFVSATKAGCVNVPVCAVIELPEQFAHVPPEGISVVLKEQGKTGTAVPGQIVVGQEGKAQLWWILPQAKADSASSWVATLKRKEKDSKEVFSWNDNPGEYLDLLFNSRKVTRYMYAYDTSDPNRVHQTCKPYHHVFDAQGENLLTKGPGGLYTHHRGVFIGWRLESGGKKYNFWGMHDGVVQRHQKFLQQTAGPVLAKSKALIHWNDKNGKPVITEQRETTVFRQPNPTVLLLEFRTQLKAVNGDVFLNGDPEHGGFQFRAHNDVAFFADPKDKRGKATYLFHEDGIDPHKDYNLPWAAVSYPLNSRRYSVQHMNHPNNPKPTIYSAYRGYGRFGAFFKKKINTGEALTLRYRIWVVESKIPEREKMASRYLAFVNGPKVEVLSYTGLKD